MNPLLSALIEDAAREAHCTVTQVLGPARVRRVAWARQSEFLLSDEDIALGVLRQADGGECFA